MQAVYIGVCSYRQVRVWYYWRKVGKVPWNQALLLGGQEQKEDVEEEEEDKVKEEAKEELAERRRLEADKKGPEEVKRQNEEPKTASERMGSKSGLKRRKRAVK